MDHTEGPWEIGVMGIDNGSREVETKEEFLHYMSKMWDETDRQEYVWLIYKGTGKDQVIIAITGNGPRGEANARLCATAPEMRDALISVQKYICGEAWDDTDVSAVIEKATGKTWDEIKEEE